MPSGKQELALNRPKFHTPYLKMAAPQVFYGSSKRAAGTAELAANLVFNYPVRPADLRSRLRVSQDGKPVAVEISTAEPDATLGISFKQDVKVGTPLRIDIAPGLRPATGTVATTTLTAQAEVPDQNEFSKDLRYLLQYPYGCLEQTVSAAFPQLYYADLAATLQQKTGAAAKAQRYNPNYHVQEAIRKIESMQLYNGSLSYWPGGDYDNWWATAYAAHFLQEAQQAGFAVNKSVLDKTLKYLQFRLKSAKLSPTSTSTPTTLPASAPSPARKSPTRSTSSPWPAAKTPWP
ncbi:hypothetical protein [Hymenobacter siberiensis]|uniref:hypothetical protein n=1 Tax=Hymenobacter siberiensis TaxID=2848396 RepID=UPI001C1E5987|nr:hypothetical protein [Hymenobacter siberiensis]